MGVLHDFIYYITLLGVAYLWRPQANETEDAYLTALLLNYPDLADVGNNNDETDETRRGVDLDIVEVHPPVPSGTLTMVAQGHDETEIRRATEQATQQS